MHPTSYFNHILKRNYKKPHQVICEKYKPKGKLPLRAFEKSFQDRPKPALETPPLKSKTKKIFKVLKVSKDLRVTVGLTVV